MGWFSGIGHALGSAVRGVDSLANKINPMQKPMMWANKQVGQIPLIGHPLEKIGNWSTTHPAEAAALAATVYFGGGALLSAYGGGAGAAGAGAAGAAGEGTAMGSAAGTLGAADSAAASAQLGLTAADVGAGAGAAGAGGALAGGAGAGAAGAGAGAGGAGAGAGNMFYAKLAAKALPLASQLLAGHHGTSGGGASSPGGAFGPTGDAPQLQPNLYNPQRVDPSLVGSTQHPYQLPGTNPQSVAGYNSLAGGSQGMAGYNPLAGGSQGLPRGLFGGMSGGTPLAPGYANWLNQQGVGSMQPGTPGPIWSRTGFGGSIPAQYTT